MVQLHLLLLPLPLPPQSQQLQLRLVLPALTEKETQVMEIQAIPQRDMAVPQTGAQVRHLKLQRSRVKVTISARRDRVGATDSSLSYRDNCRFVNSNGR
jgi:hypothetical protein